MVQPYELALPVEQDGDPVEPQRRTEWSPRRLREPRDRHPAHLRALEAVEVLPRVPLTGAPRLDLDEHERRAVVGDEVQLAEPGPMVAGEHLEPQPFEVLSGVFLALLTPGVPDVGHGTRRYGRGLMWL